MVAGIKSQERREEGILGTCACHTAYLLFLCMCIIESHMLLEFSMTTDLPGRLPEESRLVLVMM